MKMAIAPMLAWVLWKEMSMIPAGHGRWDVVGGTETLAECRETMQAELARAAAVGWNLSASGTGAIREVQFAGTRQITTITFKCIPETVDPRSR